jgi:hypothetical protein
VDPEQFWALVEKTRPATNAIGAHCIAITQRLQRLPLAEIIEFQRIFSSWMRNAYRRDLWSVVYAINGGCGDDGFADFRSWLVMQGQNVLETALSEPESLVEITAATEIPSYEGYCYVAMRAYVEATGKNDMSGEWQTAFENIKPARLRGRFISSDRGIRSKYPTLWRLMKDPPVVDTAWLKWNGGTVKRLARSIDKEKSWSDLPILADALEDTGCSEPFLLDHLRQGKRHARSCWVTYLLLR